MALKRKNPKPSFKINISTKQNTPKLCIPLRVCQTLLPSSYLDHAGISTMAKSTSKIRLIATAASDYNNQKLTICGAKGLYFCCQRK
jgi:hypothetical protein